MAVLLLASELSLVAAPGDEHWDPQFGWPGTTNYCFALKHRDGRLFTGGLTSSSGTTNSTIDVWDGAGWSSLGSVHGSLATVYDFEFVGNQVYAGGVFTGVNGVPAVGLARWDGTGWSEVGGFKGAVFALASDGLNLFVGGVFTNAGGLIVTNIAKWDGGSWSAMGAGLGPYYSSGIGGVATLLWTGSELYAGGEFTKSGAANVPALARWTGTSWTALGGGAATGNAEPARVQALAWNGSDLFVGGYFNLVGSSAFAVNLAKWNGSTWTAPLGNLNGQVYSLAISGGGVYVGGSFSSATGVSVPGIARWSGTSSSFYSPAGVMNGEVNELLAVGTNVYAGGFFTQADEKVVNHVARRNGSEWSAIGSGQGLAFVGRAVGAGSSGVFVGGLFSGAGSTPANRIARWDGSAWSSLGTGVKGTNETTGTLINQIRVRGNDVFVCGLFTNAGGVTAGSIAQWNQTSGSWSALGSGVNGNIAAMDVTADRVYIGGVFTNAGGVQVNRLASWDGSGWSGVGGGVSSNISVVVARGSDVYCAGRFTTVGGSMTANRVAKWTGSVWESIGIGAENGVNGPVTAMTVDGLNVYLMGGFTMAGTVPANRVAMWDGVQWRALGTGLSGAGTATPALNNMWVSGGSLYVAGSFTNAGGVYAPAVARWDGTNWSALGSGLTLNPGSPSALGLAALGDDLFVTGSFSGAGGRESRYFARWNARRNFDAGGSIGLVALGWADGNFRVRVTADDVPVYVIEGTSDLKTWTPVLTNSVSPFEFMDSNQTGNPWRFYRSRGL